MSIQALHPSFRKIRAAQVATGTGGVGVGISLRSKSAERLLAAKVRRTVERAAHRLGIKLVAKVARRARLARELRRVRRRDRVRAQRSPVNVDKEGVLLHLVERNAVDVVRREELAAQIGGARREALGELKLAVANVADHAVLERRLERRLERSSSTQARHNNSLNIHCRRNRIAARSFNIRDEIRS